MLLGSRGSFISKARLDFTLANRILFGPSADMPLAHIVATGDLTTLEVIMDSESGRDLRWNLRHPIQLALDAMNGSGTVLTNYQKPDREALRKVVKYLRDKEKSDHNKRRSNRLRSRIKPLWKLYYGLYQDLEQDLYRNLIRGQQEDQDIAKYRWRPDTLEFIFSRKFCARYSFINLAVAWCLIVPLLVFMEHLDTTDKAYVKPYVIASIVFVRRLHCHVFLEILADSADRLRSWGFGCSS